MNKNKITLLIKEAFSNIAYPGDNNICYKNNYGRDYEGNQMAMFFRGKTWEQITLKSLRDEYNNDGSACLSFMSPEAYRYYLPAYMIIAINEYEDADVIGDSAIHALSFPQDNELIKFWIQRNSNFSDKQEEAITKFLQFMHENHELDDEIMIKTLRFWCPFGEPA